MTSTTGLLSEGTHEFYFAALEEGDRRRAVDLVLDLLQAGVPAQTIITDVIAHGQVQVGQAWQEARWSVAMEHRASSIAESALRAVTEEAIRAPGAPTEGSAGAAVVACTEGEWHVLSARFAAEILRLKGADVTYIGPSVPAGDLAEFLERTEFPAVAISTMMPSSLVGAWRSITALRALGATVICGGRGFGPQGHWGLHLGADHWASSFTSGADLVLTAMQQPRPQSRGVAGDAEAIAEVELLGTNFDTFIALALQAALSRWPALTDRGASVRATRSDLIYTLQAVQAATLVADPALILDHVAWFEDTLRPRGLPLGFVPAAFQLLLGAIPESLPRSRAIALMGLDACTESEWNG